MPLWPYCFQVRVEGISVLDAVPMAVITLPKDGGIGWPASRSQFGLGIEEIDVAGAAFHEEPDHGFRRRRMVGLLGRERILGGRRACSMRRDARARPARRRIASGNRGGSAGAYVRISWL